MAFTRAAVLGYLCLWVQTSPHCKASSFFAGAPAKLVGQLPSQIWTCGHKWNCYSRVSTGQSIFASTSKVANTGQRKVVTPPFHELNPQWRKGRERSQGISHPEGRGSGALWGAPVSGWGEAGSGIWEMWLKSQLHHGALWYHGCIVYWIQLLLFLLWNKWCSQTLQKHLEKLTNS